MFTPARLKHRKAHKGRVSAKAKACVSLAFGSYGLKSLQPARINSRQIEAARRAATREIKKQKQGRLFIRIFPNIPVSKKPAEVRMGKGKGSVESYIVRVAPGQILFEIEGVTRDVAIKAFELANPKLPVVTKFMERYDE